MTDQKTINDIIEHLDLSGKRAEADYLRGFVVQAGEWEKDAERIDYLDSIARYNGSFMGCTHHLDFHIELDSPNSSFRYAIDAAIQQGEKSC